MENENKTEKNKKKFEINLAKFSKTQKIKINEFNRLFQKEIKKSNKNISYLGPDMKIHFKKI